MKKVYLLLSFTFIFILYGCPYEPELECPEPRCQRSPINAVEPILASLTGKMDSIIHIGDTFTFEVAIKDTINTNYGNLAIKNIDIESFFYMNYGGKPNYWDANDPSIELKRIELYSYSGSQNYFFKWDIANNRYKCFLIPTQKGKYLIELKGGTYIFQLKDGKKWVIKMGMKFKENLPFRVEQLKNFWKADSFRNTITNNSMEEVKGYWYWFEVR